MNTKSILISQEVPSLLFHLGTFLKYLKKLITLYYKLYNITILKLHYFYYSNVFGWLSTPIVSMGCLVNNLTPAKWIYLYNI